MINLFIDTNIFLNFYHFSDEDLGKLNDLEALISNTKKIKLYVPSQVIDEFKRNRESKIKDALKKFDSSVLNFQIPKMCAGYEEAKKLRENYNSYIDHKKELLKKVNADIKQKNLKADTIIKKLFDAAKTTIDTGIITKAKKRMELGNPPGKNGSHGDAINWEFLLNKVPSNEDLYFISSDRDYVSPLDENEFSQFLLEEWQENKASKVYFYKTLRNFFDKKFPDIKLMDEYIKELKITEFAESYNFDNARKHIQELSRIADFTTEQITQIVQASISNDQIYNAHIYSPKKVGELIAKIVDGYTDKIDKGIYDIFCKRFSLEPKADEIDGDEIPF